eukprot:TRINITY_DN6342_c0_g1_i10.p6 TRINITY_DN6342_c0_g1~~TRINITY_DN6342_c0_g1_i10.p6  ORF type:complete len:111 (-),score=14.73 TRINITY_DN6342_c0_g1_i10:2547-2879(-)
MSDNLGPGSESEQFCMMQACLRSVLMLPVDRACTAWQCCGNRKLDFSSTQHQLESHHCGLAALASAQTFVKHRGCAFVAMASRGNILSCTQGAVTVRNGYNLGWTPGFVE